MRLLKNSLFIVFVVVSFLLLNGCSLFSKNYDSKYVIEDVNIFNQTEDEYYVYFYKDDCSYCKDTYDTINKYLKSDSNIKLYVCDLTDSTLKKIYEGNNGQGTEGMFFVDGVTEYSDLYIATVPSVIKINDGISEFITSGRKNTIAYIEEVLSESLSHIHKYIDGVCGCGDKQVFTVFFKDSDGTILKEDKVLYGNNATPPQIKEKEGYIFTEWDSDIFNITKNMSVSAQYIQVYIKDEFGLSQLTEEGQSYLKTLYCDAIDEQKDHSKMTIEKYIGNFNGAQVVKFQRGGFTVLSYEFIADFVFVLSDTGDYYDVIYQGKLYSLTEAYAQKILSYEDIKVIFKLDGLWEEYNRFDTFDVYGYRFVLTLYGEKQLKEAYYNQFLKDGNNSINDVIIKEYICWSGLKSENKSFRVAIFDYPGSNYTKGEYKEKIGEYEFIYEDNNTIKVWYNEEKIYSLKELYDLGLIEDKYVETIYNYYNKKYSVDFILNKQENALKQYPEYVTMVKEMYLEKFYPNSIYTIDDLEIKEMYCVSKQGLFIAKIINKKDIKEEDLYTINIGGYEIINDRNNPILHFVSIMNYSKVIELEQSYNLGHLGRKALDMIEYSQKNIYYKNK